MTTAETMLSPVQQDLPLHVEDVDGTAGHLGIISLLYDQPKIWNNHLVRLDGRYNGTLITFIKHCVSILVARTWEAIVLIL